jgi:hypothetical protein
MKRSFTIFGCIAAFLCVPAFSAQTANINPVVQLHDTVMSRVVQFNLDTTIANDAAKAADDASEGKTALASLLQPALSEAKGYPDLVAAIKAFYIAANSYFDTSAVVVPLPTFDPDTLTSRPSPEEVALKQNQVKMKMDVSSKGDAMMLELKLAGLSSQ